MELICCGCCEAPPPKISDPACDEPPGGAWMRVEERTTPPSLMLSLLFVFYFEVVQRENEKNWKTRNWKEERREERERERKKEKRRVSELLKMERSCNSTKREWTMENKEWKGLSKGDDNTHHGFDKFFIKFIASFKKLTRQTTTFFIVKKIQVYFPYLKVNSK